MRLYFFFQLWLKSLPTLTSFDLRMVICRETIYHNFLRRGLHLYLHRGRQFDFVIIKVVIDNYHMRQPLDAMFALYVVTITRRVKDRASHWRSLTSIVVLSRLWWIIISCASHSRRCLHCMLSLSHGEPKTVLVRNAALRQANLCLVRRKKHFKELPLISLTLETFLHYRIYYSLDTATVLQ